jgi:hypothetical protein
MLALLAGAGGVNEKRKKFKIHERENNDND